MSKLGRPGACRSFVGLVSSGLLIFLSKIWLIAVTVLDREYNWGKTLRHVLGAHSERLSVSHKTPAAPPCPEREPTVTGSFVRHSNGRAPGEVFGVGLAWPGHFFPMMSGMRALRSLTPPRPRPKGRRRPIEKPAALTGLLCVLRSGLPWQMPAAEMSRGSGMRCRRRPHQFSLRSRGILMRQHRSGRL
jgi:hypothetical protein